MTQSEKTNLSSSFKQYFSIIPAFSEALKNEVYNIRHQVYCEDLKYEQTRSDKREIDSYDTQSLHILIRSNKTKEFIGCVRIIRPQPDSSDQLLPFEKSCSAVLNRSIIDPAKLPPHKIAEASRLAIVSSYRKRKGEQNNPANITDHDYGTAKQPRFPYIPVSLYLATFYLAHLNKIDYLFSLTEERLANHFKKLGFKIQLIGDSIEHRGNRFPSVMDVNATINGIRPILRPLYQTISNDIMEYLSDHPNM